MLNEGRLKGRSPFKITLPLSFEGEGDEGGEIDNNGKLYLF